MKYVSFPCFLERKDTVISCLPFKLLFTYSDRDEKLISRGYSLFDRRHAYSMNVEEQLSNDQHFVQWLQLYQNMKMCKGPSHLCPKREGNTTLYIPRTGLILSFCWKWLNIGGKADAKSLGDCAASKAWRGNVLRKPLASAATSIASFRRVSAHLGQKSVGWTLQKE